MSSQHAATRVTKLLRLALYCILAVAVLAIGLAGSFPDGYREYRAYLTEGRPALDFQFEDLSQDWSEADLKAHFRHVTFRCYSMKIEPYPETRNCFADIHSHNGAPAMIAQFFFADGRLNRSTLLIPWWGHGDMLDAMVRAYGNPVASQWFLLDNLGLYGWNLQGGAALFVNRHRRLNPLETSSIFWSSARECRRQACFQPRGGSGN